MIYHIDFTETALKDLERHKKSGNTQLFNKIVSFYAELKEHPRTGTGKPERLKHYPNEEVYSRRINKEHRLVYSIGEDKVVIEVLSAWGHYDD